MLKRLNSITLTIDAKSAALDAYNKANVAWNSKTLLGYVDANRLLAQFDSEFANAVRQMSAQCMARRSEIRNKAESEKNIAKGKAETAKEVRTAQLNKGESGIAHFIGIGVGVFFFFLGLSDLYDHWTHYQGHPVERLFSTLFRAVAGAFVLLIFTIGGYVVGFIVSQIWKLLARSPASAAKPFEKEIRGLDKIVEKELSAVDKLEQEINAVQIISERKT